MDKEHDKEKFYELQDYDETNAFQEPPTTTSSKQHQNIQSSKKDVIFGVLLIAIIALLLINLGVSILGISGVVNSSCNEATTAAASSSLTANDLTPLLQQEISKGGNNTISQVSWLLNNTGDLITQSTWNIINTLSINSNANFNQVIQALGSIDRNVTYNRLSSLDNKELLRELTNSSDDTIYKLANIVNTLSNLKDTSTSTAGAIDDILLLTEELLTLHNTTLVLPTSCQEIKERQPHSPSGVYVLGTGNGSYVDVYCNMGEMCGSGGGWTRLAYLDMSDATVHCPSGFRLYTEGGVRACGRSQNTASCQSVVFPSNGINYTEVCGRVVGHDYRTPDGIIPGNQHNNLNSYYVDGVSITRGSPREHVWTFIAGYSQFVAAPFNCPCNTGSTVIVQGFIGSNYYCEASHSFANDPLWDGQGCGGLEGPCCTSPDLPWFHRDYGNTTTSDHLELRVCADQGTGDEDIPVSYYEIYVK